MSNACRGVRVLDVHARKENTLGSSRVIDRFGVLCRILVGLRHHRDGFDDLDVLEEVGIENEKPSEVLQGRTNDPVTHCSSAFALSLYCSFGG